MAKELIFNIAGKDYGLKARSNQPRATPWGKMVGLTASKSIENIKKIQ